MSLDYKMKNQKNGFSCPPDINQTISWAILISNIVLFSITYAYIDLSVFLICSVSFFELFVLTIGYISTTSDPSFNPEDYTEMSLTYYCSECNMNVLKDCKHCFTCNMCVVGFDHHCKYINNCIGIQNYNLFVILVLSLIHI